MAAHRPFMQLYVSDYMMDTGHLTVEEHGAYLLLIMSYWQRGSLPTDEGQLARLARCTPDQWERLRPAVADLFGRGWKHKRIDAELAAFERKSERRAEAGRAGGKAKALNRLPSNASELPEQNPTDALASSSEDRKQTNNRKREKSASPKQTPLQALERVLSHDMAQAIVEHRSKMKRALTTKAAEILADELAILADPNAGAAMMLKRGWQGFEHKWAQHLPLAATAPTTAQPIASLGAYIQRETPQWDAWCSWYRKHKGRSPPTDKNGGWHFPSEWPPQEEDAA